MAHFAPLPFHLVQELVEVLTENKLINFDLLGDFPLGPQIYKGSDEALGTALVGSHQEALAGY